jgi:diguanylate cyclase (GGDEF)-like protein
MSNRQFQTRGSVDFDSSVDRSQCHRDPIHRTAHIQPHGTFLQIDPHDWTIQSAAENAGDFWGLEGDAPLGPPLTSILTDAQADQIEQTWRCHGDGSRELLLDGTDEPTSVLLYDCGAGIGLEFEHHAPVDQPSADVFFEMNRYLDRLEGTSTRQSLYRATVELVREVTGLDRVMLYKFDERGHGAVLDEEKRAELGSYVGQKFPASDIPEPARRLYRRNPLRYIPDATADPVAITGPDGPLARHALDLTHSSLRAVPSVHRKYLANMKVAASMSIPLLVEEDLWGLVACHATEPSHLARRQRKTCEMIGRFVSRRLSKFRASRLEASITAVDHLKERVSRKAESFEEVFEELDTHAEEICALMGADTVGLRLDGSLHWLPTAPADEAAGAITAWLEDRLADERYFETDSIARDLDEAWSHSESISGLAAVRLGASPDSYAVWLRPECPKTIDWGGDPREPFEIDETGQLNPRNSFETWTQRVAEQSEPWADSDRVTARNLRHLFSEMALGAQSHQHRRLSERLKSINRENQRLLNRLNDKARTDSLTGLANRGELERLLNREIERAGRYGTDLSFLMIDLDEFKQLNDRHGHQAGDHVLETVGELLADDLRTADLPARYGGEEFAAILPATDMAEGLKVAERIRLLLGSETFAFRGSELSVTCSIGVADFHPSSDDVETLISRADQALYRAKRAGRNTVEAAE